MVKPGSFFRLHPVHLFSWPLLFGFQIYTLEPYIQGFYLFASKDFLFSFRLPVMSSDSVLDDILAAAESLSVSEASPVGLAGCRFPPYRACDST